MILDKSSFCPDMLPEDDFLNYSGLTKPELAAKLNLDPRKLISFLRAGALDHEWLLKESVFAKRLFTDLTFLVKNKDIPFSEVLETVKLFVKKSSDLDLLITEDFQVTCLGQTVVKISSLITAQYGHWFQSFFFGNFSDRNLQSAELSLFAHELSPKMLVKVNTYFRTQDDRLFDDFSNSEIWMGFKQFHLWGTTKELDVLQKILIPRIKTEVEALEALDGANLYDLRILLEHCKKIILRSEVLLNFKEDSSIHAAFTQVTEQNMRTLTDLSDSISHISLAPLQIQSKEVMNTLTQLPNLESMTLSLTAQGLSRTAQQTLKAVTQVRTLKINFREHRSKDQPCQVDGKCVPFSEAIEADFLNQIHQLDLRKSPAMPKALPRIALGIIRLLPSLYDIRLSAAGFVDDNFLKKLIEIKPPLRMLDVGQCTRISFESFNGIEEAFPNLEVLNMQGLGIQQNIIAHLIENLPNLNHINLQNCHKIKGGFLEKLGEHLKKIKVLNLTSLKNLTEADFRTLLKYSDNLEVLNVSSCPEFKISLLNDYCCPTLKRLTTSVDAFDDENQVDRLSLHLPNLESLGLEGHPNLLLEQKKILAQL